ncbi:MAG: hypothetical protein ACYTHJ_11675 [Planctomycetota bacterium]|jgi:hypothetical protein
MDQRKIDNNSVWHIPSWYHFRPLMRYATLLPLVCLGGCTTTDGESSPVLDVICTALTNTATNLLEVGLLNLVL